MELIEKYGNGDHSKISSLIQEEIEKFKASWGKNVTFSAPIRRGFRDIDNINRIINKDRLTEKVNNMVVTKKSKKQLSKEQMEADKKQRQSFYDAVGKLEEKFKMERTLNQDKLNFKTAA